MFFFNGYEWDLQNPNIYIYIYTKKRFAHGDATSPTERVERLKGVTQKVRDISPMQKWTILW